MRVALFTNNYLPRLSGVAVAVDFLDTALRRLGHETLIVAPDYGRKTAAREKTRVFRVTSLALPRKRLSLPMADFDRREILALGRGWRPDVIHSHHPFLLGEVAADLARELAAPLCYTFHTFYEVFTHYLKLDFEGIRRAVRERVIEYCNQCDRVVAPTEPIRRHLVEAGVRTPVVAIPTGIDVERFRAVSASRVRALRRRLGLDRFATVLLSVGRITDEKNVRLGLATLAELVERGRDCALLLIGDGPAARELRRRAVELGLEERLILGGMLSQQTLAAAYLAADIFLFPSRSDTQGIVLYEALAAELPIVAVASLAAEAAVRPERNGLIAAADPSALADAVERVLESPQAFREPFDAEAFSHAALGQRYETLYRSVTAYRDSDS